MKKLFFSALACVVFAGSAFASNEVVSENSQISENLLKKEDPCQLTVRVYSVDRSGVYTLVEIGGHSVDKSGSACSEWSTGIIKEYESRWPGHKVTHELVSN
ncbi:hypothetical protein EB1_25150 [Empedobacter brevis NBRC 14943 = ATCC 43319]|uniref:Uncharacterized protein n=1 Tax=Empedobacter brevis NBRC 14943 = ATCC 43319 TaxID=1218108 RepID=A0A511NIT4_9FLAO|nr:hypothetical protein [Empedobacter brevis]GEM52725.1 hypothetical protein EB1_25150 [Empedobacter brevis NBRC 14943 = ATCC 43319]